MRHSALACGMHARAQVAGACPSCRLTPAGMHDLNTRGSIMYTPHRWQHEAIVVKRLIAKEAGQPICSSDTILSQPDDSWASNARSYARSATGCVHTCKDGKKVPTVLVQSK